MRLRGTNRNFRRVSPRVPFNPRKLFRNGEQGVHYDPSDLSTLFQDSAGTTPVTAVEQPVGLMLDKSKGLVLGNEIAPELTSENWLVSGRDATHIVTWQGGGGFRFQSDTTSPQLIVNATGRLIVGRVYEFVVTISSRTSGQVKTDSVVGSFVIPPSAGTYRFIGAAQFSAIQITRSTTNVDLTVSSISVRELPGNHAFQPTAIDRPILRQDAQGNFYLAANGTNTWMQTNSIDFTATDKVTVFTGVRKLSDAARAMVLEFGNVNFNSFRVESPFSAGASQYTFASTGSLGASVGPTGYVAPHSAVLSGLGGIASDLCALRVNGAVAAQSSGDQGTGNYGNYPLYLFRRGGTSLPFNGNFYGLLIRGALTSDPDTLKMEKWLSFKTGVQL